MFATLMTFLEEKKDLFSSHPWTFIVFGLLLFLIGFVASWRIHNYFMEIRLKELPERETLVKEREQLKADIKELQGKLVTVPDINLLQKENYQLQELIKQLQDENGVLKGKLTQKNLGEMAEKLQKPGNTSIGELISKNKTSFDDTKE